MPNWVRTKLTFTGDQNTIDRLKETVKGKTEDNEDVLFDFNKIVPIPEDLKIPSKSTGDFGMMYLLIKSRSILSWTEDERLFMERYKKKKEDDPDGFNEDIELGRKYLSNISKYGYTNCYGWCISDDGWCTKWNAQEVQEWKSNSIVFETAWTFPYNVVMQLSKQFPELTIEFEYADESAGCNDGKGSFVNGNEIEYEQFNVDSDEAYQTYFSLWSEYKDMYVYDQKQKTYIIKDDVA